MRKRVNEYSCKEKVDREEPLDLDREAMVSRLL
jgi:hypothetical protein